MAVYAIGDVQGCYSDLMRLLKKVGYKADKDCLWFAGDLVNRGPESLKTLRFVRGLQEGARVVLGNHDLHLLAMAQGNMKHAGKDHTLDDILQAKDREELLEWLRQQPLMHYCKSLGFSMIHAGLPPQWDHQQALLHARELEAVLRSEQLQDYCMQMYGNQPDLWTEALEGMDRLRYITNCFTRLRFCDKEGRLALKVKHAPGQKIPGLTPWFKAPGRASANERILFGHWSTLGYHHGHNTWCLDTGCIWGGKLTALKIRREKPPQMLQVSCKGHRAP